MLCRAAVGVAALAMRRRAAEPVSDVVVAVAVGGGGGRVGGRALAAQRRFRALGRERCLDAHWGLPSRLVASRAQLRLLTVLRRRVQAGSQMA